MKKYDVIAIGTGVGLAFVSNALNKGKKCAIIEKGKFGGTCLTRGCIPSKILVQPADMIKQAKRAKKVGVNVKEISIDFDLIAKRMWNKINLSDTMEASLFERDNLDIYKGIGEFIDNHTLQVKDLTGNYSEELYGELVVIACGARSFVPRIQGLEETGYITYETFYGDKFPKNPWKDLVIIGGGVIGCEFAHIFSSYGTNVTVIEMQDRLLPNEDKEISSFLLTQFKDNDINVYLNHVVESTTKNSKKTVKIKDNLTNEIREIKCDEIIVATGVKSNVDILKIHNTGVNVNKHGWIDTNEYLETNIDSIIAIGDINGKFQFRHKANHEMFRAFNHIYNSNDTNKPVNYENAAWAVYTYPQISHLGLTEREAFEKYDKLLIGKLNYSQVAKGYAYGYETGDSDDGFVKLILNTDMRIVGAHIIGPSAAILIQPYVFLKSTGCICNLDAFKEFVDKVTIGEDEYLFNPLQDAMIIHPSLNEVTGWAYRTLKLVERK